jgi:hypothetical protein
MTRFKYSICGLFIFLSFIAAGQDINKILGPYFAEIRTGKLAAVPRQLSLPENTKTVLRALPVYLADTVAKVRATAYSIAHLAGINSTQPALRQEAVARLTEACKDHNSGNVGNALGYLTSFKKEDFTAAAKDTLATLFKRKIAHYNKLIKLTGFLELKQLQSDLRAFSRQGSASKKDRWDAMLALARMGDTYAMDDIMKRVQRLPVTDEVVYDIFPDLVYTRQRPAIDYLLVALNSDEKNCSPASADHNEKIPCAYRVMEMLAPAIESYPLERDESGDVKAKDYTAALQTIREWFKVNKNFKIRTDKL